MRGIQVIFICGNDSIYKGFHFPMDLKVAPRVNDYVEVSSEHKHIYKERGLQIERQVNKVVWSEVDGSQVATCYL